MFRKLTLGKGELRELLGPSTLTTRQQIEESACAFLKAHPERVQQVAPECVTQSAGELLNLSCCSFWNLIKNYYGRI